jgi:hypothetical protein
MAEKWRAERWGGERLLNYVPVPIPASFFGKAVSATVRRQSDILDRQKNGGQKNEVVKYCGGQSSALGVAIASGARPSPGIQCQNRKKQG